MFYAFHQMGAWKAERGANLIDGGAPFYAVYETSDGRHVSVAAIERKFYDELIARIGLSGEALPPQYDRTRWPQLRARLAAVFASKTRDEWCAILEGTDACFAPVLDIEESPKHPHIAQRGLHFPVGDVLNPAPAPRFSRTPAEIRSVATASGSDTADIFSRWGVDPAEAAALKAAGVTA
jgi:alpha-methylacyl-CoA racemase